VKVVVVGGGKVGFYLVRTLLEKRHEVAVVEVDGQRAQRLASQLPGVLVIAGNGTKMTDLSDAGADTADVLAAVTGLDEVNLVTCQVAKREFDIRKTIARVNNPKNQAILHELGVDAAVSSTATIAHLVERETHLDGLRQLLVLQQGRMALVETRIDPTAAAMGTLVRDLAPSLPADSVLVAVLRGDRVIFPRGDTRLSVGDTVLALTLTEQEAALTRALKGEGWAGVVR
jgi:trk system potassium uptake protein TrkA